MTQESDWWRGFYEGPFGELQINGSNQHKTEAEVARVAERLPTGARILDAPCGAGRHSLELSRRGYEVLGIDFNRKVLDAARAIAKSEQLSAMFQEQDLRRMDCGNDFDAVLCLWSSLGYFGKEEENDEALERLARAVRPGGLLILDLLTSESLFCQKLTRDWSWWGTETNKVRVCVDRRWNAEDGRVESEWTFLSGKAEHSHRVSIRIYSCQELVSRLKRHGFSTFEATDEDGSPFTIGSSRLWLEARKSDQ